MPAGRIPARSALLLPVAAAITALLTGCQSMPEVPFVGKKEPAAPPPVAATAGPAPQPAAPPAEAGKLPDPPSAPAPAARTAVVSTSYSIDGAMLPVMRGEQLVETRADMRRTDTLHAFDNRLLRTFAGDTRTADIVRLDRKLVWTLNPSKKTYTECPLAGCRAPEQPRPDKPQRPDRPSEPSEPSCPLTVKKNDLKATPTAERRKINNFDTQRYQVEWLMEMADPQGRVSSNRVLLELWTTPETGVVKEAQALDNQFKRRHAAALAEGDAALGRYVPRDVMRAMGSLMGPMGSSAKTLAAWGREFSKVKGYPIVTTLSWSAQGNACGDARGAGAGAGAGAPAGLQAVMGGLFGGNKGAAPAGGGGGALLTYTHEVKSLDVRPVSDAWFAPAPDFNKVQ
jgi:hypothetical protein